MKAKTQFIKIFNKIPEKARREMVFKPHGDKPMSLAVIYFEVKMNTKHGKRCLIEMGFKDSESVNITHLEGKK